MCPADFPNVLDFNITKAELESVLTGEIDSHTHPAGGGGLNEAQVQALIDAAIAAARQADHPVGSLYFSGASTDPAIVFGFGTWARIQGRFIVGASDTDGDFDAGDEGGAKAVTLTAAQSGLPQHTHTQNAHTHTQDAHSHVITSQTATTGGATSYEHGTLDTSSAEAEATETTATTVATNQNTTAVNQNAGPSNAAEAHSILPPFLAEYIWRRTA